MQVLRVRYSPTHPVAGGANRRHLVGLTGAWWGTRAEACGEPGCNGVGPGHGGQLRISLEISFD